VSVDDRRSMQRPAIAENGQRLRLKMAFSTASTFEIRSRPVRAVSPAANCYAPTHELLESGK
jgi:hypothetical protein